MLGMIRKNSQSFVTKVIIVLIAVVFIFWGGSANFGKSSRSAATVNGKDISLIQFKQAYDHASASFEKSGTGQVPENLKKQVVEKLILNELMRQVALSIGMEVTDQAVQKYITSTLSAMTGSEHFDMQDYKRFLVGQHMSMASYEHGVRNALLVQQLTDLLISLVVVSQQEVEQILNYVSQEVKVSWTVFKSEDYIPSTVSPEELQTWYDAHQQGYQSQPERKLRYIFFSKEDALKDADITEEKVAQYYQDTIEKYRQAEERRVRYILFTVDQGADQKSMARKKAQAEEVLARLKEGADFLQMMERYSEDPQAKINGGNLGFLAQGSLPPVLDDVIFSLQLNQLSEVVETPAGYFIFKLEEIRPEKLQTLDELRASIRSDLQEREATRLLSDRALTAYEGIIKAGGMDQYSEQSGTLIQQTEFFNQETPPDALLQDPAFLQTVFNLGKGELSSIIETDKGAAICLIEDSKEPMVLDLAVVYDQALADFRREKSMEGAKAAADGLIQALRDKEPWPASTTRNESAYLKRTELSQALPDQMTRDIFDHMAIGALPQKAIDVNNDFYVYQVLDIRKSTEELADDYQREAADQIINARKQKLLLDWLDILYSRAQIWINKDLLL